MQQHELQKLRELPIEGVAERLGLQVRRHRCLCPFHDDHKPSLSFDVRRNTYRCWSCGAHGGVIDLAIHMLSTTGHIGQNAFMDACRWLADEHNVILTEYKPQPVPPKEHKPFDAARYEKYFQNPWLSAEAYRFLNERQIHPTVVKFCRLNSYGDWLQIPYYDQQQRLIGIQRRYMGSDPQKPRFLFPQGEECHLYNQQVIPMLVPGEPLFFAEGPSDVWALLSAGRKTVGIPSATLLKTSDLMPFAGRECHIYPDCDEAGEKLYQQLLDAANEIGFCLIRHDLPKGCKDFAEFWAKA